MPISNTRPLSSISVAASVCKFEVGRGVERIRNKGFRFVRIGGRGVYVNPKPETKGYVQAHDLADALEQMHQKQRRAPSRHFFPQLSESPPSQLLVFRFNLFRSFCVSCKRLRSSRLLEML